MKYDSDIHHRHSLRLSGYDYSQERAYFVTVCAQGRECLFGGVDNGEIKLNDAGLMVQDIWKNMPDRFPSACIDMFIVMPNHFHGIIILSGRGEPCVRPGFCDRPHPDVCPGLRIDNGHLSGKHVEHNHGQHGAQKHGQGEQKHGQGEHKVRPYEQNNGRPRGTIHGSVGRIVQAFKSITTDEYIRGVKKCDWKPFPKRLWQRNFYEHIIRNENELARIREYIINNPASWNSDEENPLIQAVF
jgi:putative transposase